MANAWVALEDVSFVLPNGETLFSDLHDHWGPQRIGLVGRNGCGKSVLGRILAGELQPTRGRCLRSGRVHHLAQHIRPAAGATVADLAGVRPVLDALRSIEAGSPEPSHFDAVGDRWDLRHRLAQGLAQQGLDHVGPDTPACMLSGGEAMRVAWVGAQLSEADFLVLDEPSNHLDQPGRSALMAWLAQWTRGVVVISHDRQLLAGMAQIVELSPRGLRRYGGNYAFYAQARAREQAQAQADLDTARLARRRAEQAMREQRERQEKRQARAAGSRQDANQSAILLDQQKERSDQSMGKLRRQQASLQQALSQRVREAAAQVVDDLRIHLHLTGDAGVAQRQVALLDQLVLPWGPLATRPVQLRITGQQRIGLVGPNGCGKSTLLQVLAGHVDARAGTCQVTPRRACLDQGLGLLDPHRPVLAQVQAVNGRLGEGELRMRLAQLGLGASRLGLPAGALSGGERLKAALACVLYAEQPPELLLLDEPSNHLDLPSMQALEALLSAYQGALVVASHDPVFLAQLRLTHRLSAEGAGWVLRPEPVQPAG